MKSVATVAAGALLVGQALTHPLAPSKRQEADEKKDIDTIVLQLALTLEHLEDAFYNLALDQFSEQDFIDAGFDGQFYSNIKTIAADEATHVEALTGLISDAGATPVMPCEYDFPFDDVSSFVTLSSVLEGVGTSAYLGAAELIGSDETLTIAGSILAVEALHTSIQRAARDLPPFANPFYTPLNPSPVVTLAASFITSCPATNFELPFQAFPPLTSNTNGTLTPGTEASFSFPAPDNQASNTTTTASPSRWITFISGLNITSVSVTDQFRDANPPPTTVSLTVPVSGVSGQSYAFLTSEDINGGPGALMDEVILNGPVVVEVGGEMEE